MGLSTLAVIYVGLAGGHHGAVEKQVTTLVHELHVKSHLLPEGALRSLTHHDGTTRDLVRKLKTDGVIAFEVSPKGALRVVIYDGDGKLSSFSESPLEHETLSADDLDVLRDNLTSEVESLGGQAIEAVEPAKPVETPKPVKQSPPGKLAVDIDFDEPATKPTKTAQSVDVDDENPLGPAAKPAALPAPKKSAPVPAQKIAPAPVLDNVPTETAAPDATSTDSDAPAAEPGAISAADIESMTGADSEEPTVDSSSTPAASADPELHIGVAAGIGIATRSFTPGPSAVAGYTSSPVGAVRLDVDVQPTTHVQLRLSTERTLGMTTPMEAGDASTTVSRWEATGGYAMQHGRFSVIPTLGVGRRAFAIDSTDTARTPDSAYDYLMLGVRGRLSLSKRIAVAAQTAFEPVVAGAEGTEMALGEASRWAVASGADLEVAFGHAHVRAAVDYQRFTWTWNMAGDRGAGGATDSYLTGSLSIGAEY